MTEAQRIRQDRYRKSAKGQATARRMYLKKYASAGARAERNAYESQYRKTPQGLAKLKTTARKYLYGLTEAAYQRLHLNQDGLCGNHACGAFIELNSRYCHVDHCHRTGRVRGLLCRSCNLLLGRLEKNKERLEGLRYYLEKTNPPQSTVAETVA